MKHENERISDLTQGRPFGVILRFCLPLLGTNMLQQFYNMADTFIVGKGLGDAALAAVGNMGPLNYLILGCCIGLANGFAIPVARTFGARDHAKLRQFIAAAVILSAVIAAAATVLTVFFLRSILIKMQVPPEILSESLQYGYFIFGGICITMTYNLSGAVLRALGDSRTPLIAIMISTITNIVLDILLVLVIRTGVAGAAAATVFSQLIASVICLKQLSGTPVVRPLKEDFRYSGAVIPELLRNGIPMAVMNSITAAGCMVVQYFINGMGVIYAAAYSVCVRFDNFFMQPAIALGSAISAYTSQNYGAGRFDRIRSGVRLATLYAFAVYLFFGSFMVLFPRQLATLMLTGEDTVALAMIFLPRCGLALWVVDLIFVYRPACQGMGRPLIPMISGIAEMLLRVFVIVAFLPGSGFHAAAWAEIAALTGAMVMNLAAYLLYIRREERRIHRQLS